MYSHSDISQYSDSELFDLASNGDKNAVMILIQVRLADKLKKGIRKFYTYATDEEVNNVMSEFMMHLIRPDSNNNWRLRNLKAQDKPAGYIYRALDNWLKDTFEKKKGIQEVSVDDSPCQLKDNTSTVAMSVEAPQTYREARIESVMLALMQLYKFTPEERYIYLTVIIAMQNKSAGDGKKPLKIKEKIAAELGLPEAKVGRIYDRMKGKLRSMSSQFLQNILDPDAFDVLDDID